MGPPFQAGWLWTVRGPPEHPNGHFMTRATDPPRVRSSRRRTTRTGHRSLRREKVGHPLARKVEGARQANQASNAMKTSKTSPAVLGSVGVSVAALVTSSPIG